MLVRINSQIARATVLPCPAYPATASPESFSWASAPSASTTSLPPSARNTTSAESRPHQRQQLLQKLLRLIFRPRRRRVLNQRLKTPNHCIRICLAPLYQNPASSEQPQDAAMCGQSGGVAGRLE